MAISTKAPAGAGEPDAGAPAREHRTLSGEPVRELYTAHQRWLAEASAR